MSKYTDEVQVVVETSKNNYLCWYWAVKIDGEVYTDGEEGDFALANHRAMMNLNEWKEKLA